MKNEEKQKNNTIEYFTEGIYTKREAKEALELLQDKENNALVDGHMSKVWNQIQETSDIDEDDFYSGYEKAENLLKRIRKVPFYKKYLRYSVAAASIAIIVSLSIFGYNYFGSSDDFAIKYTEVSTSFGERREIILPDGTIVFLNACTHISYPEKFSGDVRTVKLNGEAYFQVSKNKNQPFIITTDNFNVRVLGTVFNVRAYPKDEIQSVNVESGKVQVDMPDAMSRLLKDEQLVINTVSNKYTKNNLQYDDVAPWRTGDLYFNDTPIKDVANQLERIYNYSLVFQEGQDFNHLISGEHDKASLEDILESIRLATGIQYKIDKSKKYILLYK